MMVQDRAENAKVKTTVHDWQTSKKTTPPELLYKNQVSHTKSTDSLGSDDVESCSENSEYSSIMDDHEDLKRLCKLAEDDDEDKSAAEILSVDAASSQLHEFNTAQSADYSESSDCNLSFSKRNGSIQSSEMQSRKRRRIGSSQDFYPPNKVRKARKDLKRQRTGKSHKSWSEALDRELDSLVRVNGNRNWSIISELLSAERSPSECKSRWEGQIQKTIKKGSWAEEEDSVLSFYASMYVKEAEMDSLRLDWSSVALHVPNRTGKQCRERWVNHLSPSINKSPWTKEEDQKLIEELEKNPNRWAQTAKIIGNGRTENMVKVRFNALTRSLPGKLDYTRGNQKADKAAKVVTTLSSELFHNQDLTEITNKRRKNKKGKSKSIEAKQPGEEPGIGDSSPDITSGPLLGGDTVNYHGEESDASVFALQPPYGDYRMLPYPLCGQLPYMPPLSAPALNFGPQGVFDGSSAYDTDLTGVKDYVEELTRDMEVYFSSHQ